VRVCVRDKERKREIGIDKEREIERLGDLKR
jgi:hypothetical protein